MNSFSITAQTPIPNTLADKDLEARLLKANKATTQRAMLALNELTSHFETLIQSDKKLGWQDSVSDTLERIRFQAMDLLQAQFGAQYISLNEKDQSVHSITQLLLAAQTALQSSSSPIVSALALSKQGDTLFQEIRSVMLDSHDFLAGQLRKTPLQDAVQVDKQLS